MKIRRSWTLGMLLVFSILATGCHQGPAGEIITVEGPANDTVVVQAAPTNTACFVGNSAAVINLPSGPVQSNGFVTVGPFNGFTDDTAYTIASSANSPTPCIGVSNVVACGAVITLSCNAMALGGAQGTFTVSGQDDAVCYVSTTNIQSGPCAPGQPGKTIYNTGTVSVTFNGQTISATYSQTSTPLALATKMALALNQNSVLSSEFAAGADGSVGIVRALNSGSQYDYPWTSSCTYNTHYFSWCSFTVGLSPSSSLAPQ